MARLSPRIAISAIFFLNGAVFSAWYARVPAISDRLDLSPGEIGVALLGAPAGLLVAQPIVGAVVARHGSRALAPWSMLAVALPALAGDLPTLVLAVAVTGAVNGALDIAMNAQGLTVDRAARHPLFASLHAAFSFGALTGAASAGLIAGAGVEPLEHLVAWGAAGALVAVVACRGLVEDAEHDPRGGAGWHARRRGWWCWARSRSARCWPRAPSSTGAAST